MVKHFTSEALIQLEKNKRAHLINSLGGFKSLALVGTTDKNGNTNLAVFSSVFHVGANPPLIGLIFRPSPPERNTFSNIIETGYYTINHVNESIYKQAHQTSARYDKDVSEFEITGLNEEYKDHFLAPYVAQSKIQLGIEFKEKIDISSNNTTLVIGEIKHIYVPQDCIAPDGFVDIEKANTVTCSGLDSYHKTIKLDRLSYAKPNLEIKSIPTIE
jgi:flavin reductase (DIM6/NTAB) family NADH-FMN oxidoreductase RutF